MVFLKECVIFKIAKLRKLNFIGSVSDNNLVVRYSFLRFDFDMGQKRIIIAVTLKI